MAKKNDEKAKDTTSIIEEIEKQLEEALGKKKQEVEKELEERIQREKEEAQRRMEELDKELTEEKETLVNFKRLLAEFETNRTELKKEIRDHLDKAIQYQTEIETLTGQTLEELKKVSELNQKLEDLQQETGEKVSALKKELEEKFGIVAEVPESGEPAGEEIDLEQELSKLKKIKELLNSKEPVEAEAPVTEPEKEEAAPSEEAEQEKPREEGEEGIEEAPVEEAEEKAEEAEKAEEEERAKKAPEEGPSEEQPAEEATEEKAAEETKPEEKEEEAKENEKAEPEKEQTEQEAAPEEGKEEEDGGEKSFQDTFQKLENYRKGTCNDNNGEVSYFEFNERIVVDGECLVATLNNSFEEAKKLYIKLSQTESPKDQFFIKQEIIRQQETLRKVMLRSIRLCERENCSLPAYTEEVLNLDVLKTILEKVSMENWSNQDDFAAFDNYSKELKDAFYTKITPPAEYLESIMQQLDIKG